MNGALAAEGSALATKSSLLAETLGLHRCENRSRTQEDLANVEARSLTNGVPMRFEPGLGGLPAKPLKVKQKREFGVHLARGSKFPQLLLEGDHVDVHPFQPVDFVALEPAILEQPLDEG